MEENGFAKLFLRHLFMAIPWGIIFLIVFFIASIGIKQQIKEGVEFGLRKAVYETRNFAFRYDTVVPVKQNIKEGIEFLAKTAKDGLKDFLSDPQVKEDLKEVFEYRPESYRE